MRLPPELRFMSDVLGLSLKPSCLCFQGKSLGPLDQINWRKVIRLATCHGIAGLLLHWLKELKLGSTLPRELYESLQRIHESQRDIWQNHREIIKKILKGFHGRNIEVILLKGAQLGHTDYPHFSLRLMEDIDLLVRGSNKLRVINLMLEMRFNLYHTGETCDKFFITQAPKRRKQTTQKPIFIEIHSNLQVPVRLNKSFNVDMDEFWNGTQMEYFDGFPFRQLHPHYNLIYLCTHLAEHHFSRLIWAYDIALLIHRHEEEIDWEKLEDHCRRMKVRNSVYQSLSLCRELFQISIPEKTLRNLSPASWRRKIGYYLVNRNLPMSEQPMTNRFSRFLIKMLSIDSWIEAILWFFFPTRDWIKQRYSVEGPFEVYPYYLLHPILYLIRVTRASMK